MIEIVGLPASIRTIPEDHAEWKLWAPKATAFRVIQQDKCLKDTGAQADSMEFCAADPLYEFLVFGCIFEPRPRMNDDGSVRESGWYPWIPYHFQALLVRAIEEARRAHPGTAAALLGRGDLVNEKARGMAGSWTFCGAFANKWRWGDGYVGGMMSYKEDLVDERDSTDSLFYKLRGYLGLNQFVPESRQLPIGASSLTVPIRPPAFLIPAQVNDKILLLANLERGNLLKGYSTTNLTTTGGRLTELLLDEAAKFRQLKTVHNSSSAVTDHRYLNSSADTTYGTGFRDVSRAAERANMSGQPGPLFLRLRPDQHPERDSVWREEIEARHSTDPFAAQMLAREYDLDYEAGHGSHIYPGAQAIVPQPIEFHPGQQSLDFCIDPGIRDMTAFHLMGYDPAIHRYQLLASYANSGKPADFYASLVCASPLGAYDYGDEEFRIMEWFDHWGARIRFWIGDPAGKARGGGQATSFYDEFRLATMRMTDGRKAINIWSSDKREYRFIEPRISALRWLLELLDVSDNPDTIRTLEAIRDHRFPAETERETTLMRADPVRTWGHDRVTALEFYATHRRVGSVLATTSVAPPIRVKLGGSPWTKKRASAHPWKWR